MNSSLKDSRVLIISAVESFLAMSLMTKLQENDIRPDLIDAEIKEIEEHIDGSQLIILFLSEELSGMPETLVYLKDILQDRELSLITIGEEEDQESLKKTIPEQYITEWFKRPLDFDALIKKILSCLDEERIERQKKTVLIVDDDITYMRTVYEWLKGKYHVGMASNGVQAISYLAKNRADLILLDYEMPVANGPQVLSMLKSDSETGQIPVMFLTGHGDKESVLSVVGLNPVDYLLKTISREALLQKLEDFFA